jgi:hypothetical protein
MLDSTQYKGVGHSQSSLPSVVAQYIISTSMLAPLTYGPKCSDTSILIPVPPDLSPSPSGHLALISLFSFHFPLSCKFSYFLIATPHRYKNPVLRYNKSEQFPPLIPEHRAKFKKPLPSFELVLKLSSSSIVVRFQHLVVTLAKHSCMLLASCHHSRTHCQA